MGARARRRWRRGALGLLLLAVLAAPLLTAEPVEPLPHFTEHNPASIAHAGAQGHAPANTIEAFALALDLGADTLEMDLQLTADGEVVAHHDGTVDRETDGTGAIRDLTLDELAELDAGYGFTDADGGHPWRGRGVSIPTLEEVFEAFPGTFMVLELKTDGGPDLVAAVAERVRAHDRADDVVIASFDLAFIEEARQRLPEVATTMPEDEAGTFHILQALGLHRWWSPPGQLLQVPEFHDGVHVATHRFFTAAAELGVHTHVWTVNDREDLHRHLAAGADGIITDYPERVVEVAAEREVGARRDGVDLGSVGATAWLQERTGWLTPLMRAVTFLGDEDFYVLGFPVLYWAVSRRVGLRVGVMLLLSAGLNEAAKLAGRTPRPTFLDPSLGVVEETTLGAPSGHAQNGLVVWGVLAAELRRRWVWVAALVLIALLGLSRIHLGVHYPVDLVVGWALGGLLLLGYLRWREPLTAWLESRSARAKIGASLAGSLALVVLAIAARLAFLDWQPPTSWIGIDAGRWPMGLSHAVTPAGALFGLGVGTVWLASAGGFRVDGPLWQRALRCLVGLAGVLALWQGLGALFPGGEDPVALAYRWLRYTAVGVWITGLAPLLFVRLGLAEPERSMLAEDAAVTGQAGVHERE